MELQRTDLFENGNLNCKRERRNAITVSNEWNESSLSDSKQDSGDELSDSLSDSRDGRLTIS